LVLHKNKVAFRIVFARLLLPLQQQANFHSKKYFRSLVQKIRGSGSHVFEKAQPVNSIQEARVKIDRNRISFDRVVMATNYPF